MQFICKMLESCKNGGPATPQNTYSRKATPTTFLSPLMGKVYSHTHSCDSVLFTITGVLVCCSNLFLSPSPDDDSS